MFLPVLIVREFGPWGWVVFAAPNVVGAAAMGWVLRGGASERLALEHRAACLAFSAVTIAFHVFFVLWLVPRLVGLPAAATTFALAAVYLLATMRRASLDLAAALGVWIVSLACMAWFVLHGGVRPMPASGTLNLGGLTVVCAFGFALCPYLDLTFHRARQALDPAESRWAFSIGFGVCFLAMIVFTLLYAGALIPAAAVRWVRPVLAGVVGTHMIVQAAFTLAVHARSFTEASRGPGGLFGLLVAAQVALFLALASNVIPPMFGLDPGELIYRLFMSAYGLAAPTYVWVCMVPFRAGPALTRARLRNFAAAVVVATPMFYLGFLRDHTLWLVPGVAVLIASRFLSVPRATADPGAVFAGAKVVDSSSGF